MEEEEENVEEEEEEESSPGSTLFIKNLNFSTTEQTLLEVLDSWPQAWDSTWDFFFCGVNLVYFFNTDIFQMWEGEILLSFQEKG